MNKGRSDETETDGLKGQEKTPRKPSLQLRCATICHILTKPDPSTTLIIADPTFGPGFSQALHAIHEPTAERFVAVLGRIVHAIIGL